MYTLYTIPGSCSTGIAVLMEKLGVSYDLIKRDDVENYTDIVPTNQVPALKTEDGQVLTEGAAIVQFLLDNHENSILPTTKEERIAFFQWLNFDYATLHPAYAKIFAVATNEGLEEESKGKLMQDLADKTSTLWDIVDKRAAESKFLLGETPSQVDYMVAIYSTWGNYFPDINIAIGENAQRLIKDVAELPEFKAGYAKEQVEFKLAA